jgi:prepilin signal peptidase PulO-like enzyme (type II secretory pathway)
VTDLAALIAQHALNLTLAQTIGLSLEFLGLGLQLWQGRFGKFGPPLLTAGLLVVVLND